MNTIRETDVSDAELSRAKDQIIKSFPARFATRGSIAGQLADLAIYGLPDSYLKDYTKKIAAITKEDVHKMARKYLTADKLSIVVVGDQKLLKDGLSKIAPVELRDLEGNPLPVPVASESGSKGGGEGKSEE